MNTKYREGIKSLHVQSPLTLVVINGKCRISSDSLMKETTVFSNCSWQHLDHIEPSHGLIVSPFMLQNGHSTQEEGSSCLKIRITRNHFPLWCACIMIQLWITRLNYCPPQNSTSHNTQGEWCSLKINVSIACFLLVQYLAWSLISYTYYMILL